MKTLTIIIFVLLCWLFIAFCTSCGVPVTVNGQFGIYRYSANGVVITPKYPIRFEK